MTQDQNYWFPAKRYGWGWGMPMTWQGWAVMAIFFALLIAVAVTVPPQLAPVKFVSSVVVLTIALTAVCWWKGEPPRWRWGGE